MAEVGFNEEKIVFAGGKRFSGNTENVVGLEVLSKIVRRCVRAKVVRFNKIDVFGWFEVYCVCWVGGVA